MSPPKAALASDRQRGVALITALLVVALATMAAVSLTASHQLDLRRAQTTQDAGQAQLHAASAEALAQEFLGELQAAPEQAAAMLDEECRSPPLELERGQARIQAWVEDLHCRLNINNLADEGDERTESAFIRLVERANQQDPEVSLSPEQLVEAIRNWVDPEVTPEWYSRQDPPYRPANQPLASVSELRLIRGVSPAAYRALEPYVTALPETGTPINAHLAPEAIREAYNLPDPGSLDEEAERLGDYARLQVRVTINERHYHQCSVIYTGSGEVVLRRLRPC